MQKVVNFLIYIFLYYIILEKKFKSFIISFKIYVQNEKREAGQLNYSIKHKLKNVFFNFNFSHFVLRKKVTKVKRKKLKLKIRNI